MWIHLVALGLINGASSAALPPEPSTPAFFNFQPWGSNSSKEQRKRWTDKQAQQAAQALKHVEVAQPVAVKVDAVILDHSLQRSRQVTDKTKRSLLAATKAAQQQQMMATLKQALIEQQQIALLIQDDDDALCALLLSI